MAGPPEVLLVVAAVAVRIGSKLHLEDRLPDQVAGLGAEPRDHGVASARCEHAGDLREHAPGIPHHVQDPDRECLRQGVIADRQPPRVAQRHR